MSFAEALARASDVDEAATLLVEWLPLTKDRGPLVDATVAHLVTLGMPDELVHKELIAALVVAAHAKMGLRARRGRALRFVR